MPASTCCWHCASARWRPRTKPGPRTQADRACAATSFMGGTSPHRPCSPRRRPQPSSWTMRWWRRQSSTKFGSTAGPPWVQCWRWWQSVHCGGRSHRPATQRRSRASTARRVDGGDGPRGVADLRLQLAPAGDASEGGVAGQPANGLGRHEPANLQFARRGTGRSQQRVQAGPDDQVRPRPRAGG
jgi:hypothetical protein